MGIQFLRLTLLGITSAILFILGGHAKLSPFWNRILSEEHERGASVSLDVAGVKKSRNSNRVREKLQQICLSGLKQG
jgi:hypothetical protein